MFHVVRLLFHLTFGFAEHYRRLHFHFELAFQLLYLIWRKKIRNNLTQLWTSMVHSVNISCDRKMNSPAMSMCAVQYAECRVTVAHTHINAVSANQWSTTILVPKLSLQIVLLQDKSTVSFQDIFFPLKNTLHKEMVKSILYKIEPTKSLFCVWSNHRINAYAVCHIK